jgi:DNA-binding transcriptional MerR regulator
MKKYYRSGELARRTGVSTDTLRHYERMGLIARARRSANGYREYAPETLDRVRLIQSSLAIGFSLAELSRLLRIRDTGGAPCMEVRLLVERKSEELEARIRDLSALRRRLRGLMREWDHRLAATAPGMRAGLLQSLAGAIPRQPRRPRVTTITQRRKHK